MTYVSRRILGILALALLLAPARSIAAEAHKNFDFVHSGKHITVWFYEAQGATPQAPVVIVMHGVGRNGEDYLSDWIPLAKAHGFLLVVPEFSKAEFPGEEAYNYGNTVDTAGRPLPREQWSFSAIEPVFDAVKSRTGNRSERYCIYGHSAGAQFVHRFVCYVPGARVERVVAANAGAYLLPDWDGEFPYGLKGSAVTEADLRKAFSLPFTILLGTADTDPNSRALPRTPAAEAQGPYRLARGKNYYAHAQAAAKRLGVPLAWRLAFAPGIAHSNSGMAPFAAQVLFPDSHQH